MTGRKGDGPRRAPGAVYTASKEIVRTKPLTPQNHPTPTASTPLVDVSSHGLPGTDVPVDFIQMLQMAEALAEAELYVPSHLHGKPSEILALMFRARALDVPIAVAWDELYATKDGDVGRRAKLVRALARRAGHRIDFVERDRFHAVAVVRTADGERHEVSFTIQEAVERGYTDPSYEYADAWTRMPEDMLVARVTTRAVNWFCPEVLLGLGAALPEHADDPQNASQVVEIREERRAQVGQALRLVKLAGRQPNGQVRLNLLRGLFMECRDAMLLDYDTDGTGVTSVRHVLVDGMRGAERLARQQSSGQAPTADPADGPQTLDDLRGLDVVDDGPDGAAAEQEAEEAGDAQAERRTPEECAGEGHCGCWDLARGGHVCCSCGTKKPPKRAARKAAAKKAPGKASSGAQESTAGASGPQAEAAAGKDGSKTQGSPAARSADRPAARPDDSRLPCGCLVDHIISTGVHADACTDRKGGAR